MYVPTVVAELELWLSVFFLCRGCCRDASVVGTQFVQKGTAVTFDVVRVVRRLDLCWLRLLLAVRESFWRFDLVSFFCCLQAVQTEWVLVGGGLRVLVSVVPWAQSFLADDVGALDAPVSGATKHVSDDSELQLRHWWCE